MTSIRTAVLFVGVVLSSVAGFAAVKETPRLAVVVVVDQMRADYLERDPSFTGGFKRLAKEGAVYSNAHHLHIPTETGPGHAAISTGRAPRTHGIVANEWWDRALATETYCVADSSSGIGPEHLLGPTLADALKSANPKARVFSISGKDRAAVLLGGRTPDLALWMDRKTGHFATASYYRRPAWLGAFNDSMTATADEATARLVDEVMSQEGVGRGPSTDLLLVSFSATDLIGHRYGTEGPEMASQLRALDLILGKLLKKWEQASGGKLILALTADHGAIPSPDDPMGRQLSVRKIGWDVLGSAMEQTLQKQWPAPGNRWIVNNSLPHIYLNRDLAVKRDLPWNQFTHQAAEALSRVDGIQNAYAASDVAGLNPKDPVSTLLARSNRTDRGGDILALLARNILVHDGPGTSHGTHWDYDTHVPLVFWGRAIAPGRYTVAASPLDVAPTVANFLGLLYPAADGGALRREFAPVP